MCVCLLQCLEPSKWWMVRGNHETREVNGNIEHYGEGSFLWQSVSLFGDTDGHLVCESINQPLTKPLIKPVPKFKSLTNPSTPNPKHQT